MLPVRFALPIPVVSLLLTGLAFNGQPASASSPAAWEALRLRALQACTAETIASGFELLAVEPIAGTGASYEPTAEGVRLSLRVQKPGEAPRRVDCRFRRPLFNPPLLR